MKYHHFITLFLLLISCSKGEYIDLYFAQSPIGNLGYSKVYDFIIDYLEADKHKYQKRENAYKLEKEELDMNQHNLTHPPSESLKSRSAGIVETDMSHMLKAFAVYEKCVSIALYARNGQLIAQGSPNDKIWDYIILEDYIWNEMLSRKEAIYKDFVLKDYADKIGIKSNQLKYMFFVRSILSHKGEVIGFVRYIKPLKCSYDYPKSEKELQELKKKMVFAKNWNAY